MVPLNVGMALQGRLKELFMWFGGEGTFRFKKVASSRDKCEEGASAKPPPPRAPPSYNHISVRRF